MDTLQRVKVKKAVRTLFGSLTEQCWGGHHWQPIHENDTSALCVHA